MTLQSRMHTEVCLPAGLTACLCGAYAGVAQEEVERLREENIEARRGYERTVGFMGMAQRLGVENTDLKRQLAPEIGPRGAPVTREAEVAALQDVVRDLISALAPHTQGCETCRATLKRHATIIRITKSAPVDPIAALQVISALDGDETERDAAEDRLVAAQRQIAEYRAQAAAHAEDVRKIQIRMLKLEEALERIYHQGPIERFGANTPERLVQWVREVRGECQALLAEPDGRS